MSVSIVRLGLLSWRWLVAYPSSEPKGIGTETSGVCLTRRGAVRQTQLRLSR